MHGGVSRSAGQFCLSRATLPSQFIPPSDNEHERQDAGDDCGGAEAHQRNGGTFEPVRELSRSVLVSWFGVWSWGKHGGLLGSAMTRVCSAAGRPASVRSTRFACGKRAYVDGPNEASDRVAARLVGIRSLFVRRSPRALRRRLAFLETAARPRWRLAIYPMNRLRRRQRRHDGRLPWSTARFPEPGARVFAEAA